MNLIQQLDESKTYTVLKVVNSIHDKGLFAKKPMVWKSVPTISSELVKDVLDNANQYTMKELYGELSLKAGREFSPVIRFKISTPRVFVLKDDSNNTYIVDTQGDDFAKYVVKVV